MFFYQNISFALYLYSSCTSDLTTLCFNILFKYRKIKTSIDIRKIETSIVITILQELISIVISSMKICIKYLEEILIKVITRCYSISEIAAELYPSGLKKLGLGTGELQFHTCKKPPIYGDDFLSHGLI